MNFCISYYYISFINICFISTLILSVIDFTSSETLTISRDPTEAVITEDVSPSLLEANTTSSELTKPQIKISAADLKTEVPSRRPEKKEPSSKTTTTPAPQTFSTKLYRLDSENSGACILFQVDAVVAFNYSTKHGEKLDRELYLPKDAEVTGDCSKADDSTLVFRWDIGFVLSWFFSKTPGGERWFVEKVELRYDSSDRHFEHIAKPEKLTLSTPRIHGSLLFPTPVGQSYTCKQEIAIKLTNRAATDTVGVLLLRDLKVQPFIFKDEFGPEYMCPAPGSPGYQSETIPLIVGSTLAAACLFTVTGYGIFRYFKIKKVQYDTME